MRKVVTVFGATGAQGGALLNHILDRRELSKLFRLRGVTRDSSKQAAISLQQRGVEIVQANLDDPASLAPAVAGSYAVFSVTNYWETGSAAVEIAQGKAIADASVNTGVALLIWSSLPNVAEMTKGKATVPHFDSKAIVEAYIRGLPIMSAFFMAGWYMQNQVFWTPPRTQNDGTALFTHNFPNALIPLIDITDTGKFVTPILLNPDKYNGTNFTCATDFYTPSQLIDRWSTVTGMKIEYRQVETEETDPMQQLMRKSLEQIKDRGYFGATGRHDLDWTLAQMTEKPTTWEDFVKRTGLWLGQY